MTKYPTPGEYQEAVQFPEAAFRDPALQAAVPEAGLLGLPQVITGAFAAVFPMQARGRRWAVKCFLTEVPDQQTRYRAIDAFLEAQPLPCAVPFDYQPQGITVEGRTLPVLKMAWVDGVPLNRFVAAHLEAPEVLGALAAQWAALLADLEAAGFAHGDLQHGNVLVVEEDGGRRLKLVDYDTCYVPALRGRRSPEVGHRNYQHPDRDERDFGPYLDRFAGLVIYTALQACRARPALWERYDTGENLLFRAADFYDPTQSALFDELAALAPVAPLAEALRRACHLEPEAVPPLAEVRRAVQAGTALPARPARRQTRQRSRGQEPGRTPAAGFERAFLPALGAGGLVAVALFLAGAVVAAGALLVGGAAGGVGAAAYRHGRLPAVRRRRRLEGEVAYLARRLDGLRQEQARLAAERAAFVGQQASRYEERLRERQEEVLYDRLKYHFVNEAAEVDGLTHRVVVRLKAAGIRTAYQATPERLADVREIGDRSRTRLLMWRAALVARYRDEIPERLSPAEERRLERRAAHHLARLEAERERLQEKITLQEEEKARVVARLEERPAPPFGAYLRQLLRLG